MNKNNYLTDELDQLRVFTELLECVQQGMTDELPARLQNEDFLQYYENVLLQEDLFRMSFLIQLGFTAAYAIQGGLDMSCARDIFTYYAKESANISSHRDFTDQTVRMVTEFTESVARHNAVTYENPIINSCMSFIENNLSRKISAGDVAANCHYSASYIQHLFRKELGKSINDIIREKKIERACFYLASTDLKCAQIAQKLNFCSQSQFIETFKKSRGTTPAKYRNAHRTV